MVTEAVALKVQAEDEKAAKEKETEEWKESTDHLKDVAPA